MSACDPLLQAERRLKARCLNRSRWDLFPCRGSVVPCRTLPLVSVTRDGIVKPGVSQTLPFSKRGAGDTHAGVRRRGGFIQNLGGSCMTTGSRLTASLKVAQHLPILVLPVR